jgi:hypothetical protein
VCILHFPSRSVQFIDSHSTTNTENLSDLAARIVTKDGIITFAYLTFSSKEALLMDGTVLKGRRMHVDVATP